MSASWTENERHRLLLQQTPVMDMSLTNINISTSASSPGCSLQHWSEIRAPLITFGERIILKDKRTIHEVSILLHVFAKSAVRCLTRNGEELFACCWTLLDYRAAKGLNCLFVSWWRQPEARNGVNVRHSLHSQNLNIALHQQDVRLTSCLFAAVQSFFCWPCTTHYSFC